MHISEGILSPPLLAGGWLVSLAGVAYGMRRLDPAHMPRVALVSAAYFVVTFVRLPLGPVHLHLVATGLAGILLGWRAFPALFVALALQAVLFQFGGLAVLGVNTLVMALPAVCAHYVFRWATRGADRHRLAWAAGWAGALAVTGNVALMSVFLIVADRAFILAAAGVLMFHVPLLVVEGVITALAVWFLAAVRRDLLPGAGRTP